MRDEIRSKTLDVFLSYKRSDDELREAVDKRLDDLGFNVWWDTHLSGGGEWAPELLQRIAECRAVVVLWTPAAARKPAVVLREMNEGRKLGKLIPVRVEKAPLPRRYGRINFLPLRDRKDDAQLDELVEKIVDSLTDIEIKPSREPARTADKPSIPIELNDLPTAPPKFVGREQEIADLESAWSDPSVNCVSIYAPGGAGKSALLRKFLNERLRRAGDGAQRILGWSAYSQGSGSQNRASADTFISEAITKFFGQPQKSLPSDAGARGRELARLVQQERMLLLLDGLEPLQNPPGVNKGRILDPGLSELIKALAAANPGLMVLTSRQEIVEATGFEDVVVDLPLGALSDDDGARLLVELGCRGRAGELEEAVRDVAGHALSVTLLGTFLAETCAGDIKQRDRFELGKIALTPEEQSADVDKTLLPAKRAEKVMRGYLEQLERLSGNKGAGAPDVALLNLLGLFDRPADGPAVRALLEKRIDGLTDGLFVDTTIEKSFFGLWKSVKVRDLTPKEREGRLREAKSRLRKLRLLGEPDPADPKALDAHPIVRAYFAEQLKTTAADAAKRAHDILYAHYCAQPAQDQPDTLAEMQPLFHALGHGVAAGRAQEAWDMFRRRIVRRNDKYILSVLGAMGPYLAALAPFFEIRWRAPSRKLSAHDQAFALGEAAYALQSLGRLQEALAPRKAAMERFVAEEEWVNASVNAEVLSSLALTAGDVAGALAAAAQGIDFAEQSGVAFRKEVARSDLAAAAHAAGDRDRAAKLHREAEEIRGEPLVSLQGYQLGDLLLDQGAAAEALRRGEGQLDAANQNLGRGLGLDDIGFGHLLIGRAEAALGRDARANLDAAVEGLRKSGMMYELPKALLARAAYLRGRLAAGEAGALEQLRADLDEVQDIADPEMKLHLADLALERARLALDAPQTLRGPQDDAAPNIAEAERLIQQTGYHRRDGELAELKQRLAAA